MKIGIIQGRLSPPVEGFQETPKNWQKEFEYLKQLNMNHIEWVVTKKSFSTNPIFFEDLTDYSISSVCADNIIDRKIDNHEFLLDNIVPLCKVAQKNNIKNITLPLLEDSSVENSNKRDNFCTTLKYISSTFQDLNFLIEAELGIEELREILNVNSNIYVTYDTGNITSFGLSHDEYINSFLPKIKNVHLKDRTKSGHTVAPFSGDTDFYLILKKLVDMNYNCLYTLQTARGPSGREKDTILKHKEKFEEVINEYKKNV